MLRFRQMRCMFASMTLLAGPGGSDSLVHFGFGHRMHHVAMIFRSSVGLCRAIF